MDQTIAQQKIKDVTTEIEGKIQQVNALVCDLLFTLDLEEQGGKCDWSDIVQKFCSLSGTFSSLEQILRKPGMDFDDNVKLLKMTQLVPQIVSLENDTNLQEITEGRLSSFNHNVVPILLRTKLKPEVEDDELSIDRDRLSKQVDVNRQIKSLNAHVDMLSTKLSEFSRLHHLDRREFQQSSHEETMKLVKAVCLGKGIQPKTSSLPTSTESPSKGSSSTSFQHGKTGK
uniref:Mediator of RNA polymerase II transcription subunit 8 n=1 Tax=Meloidogyne hapla TaxID=6305 RepID=A0A1I8B507_MELHA